MAGGSRRTERAPLSATVSISGWYDDHDDFPMNAEECRSRAGRERSARLATVRADNTVDIVPIVFAFVDDAVVFAIDHKPKITRRLQRLRNIDQNPLVTALFDHYDEDWNQLWWVRMRGSARELTDDGAQIVALDALEAKYDQYVGHRPAGAVVRIEPTEWRGWSYLGR